MNITFEHKELMINFVVVSPELWLHVLHTQVNTGAELSTDHDLVVSWIRWRGGCQIDLVDPNE